MKKPEPNTLTQIKVCGFKSIRDEESISIANMTILAGANSSGKSSMMQPCLLMKQTLEAAFDPGALLLNGPNVKFTNTNQLLWHVAGQKNEEFQVAFCFGDNDEYSIVYKKQGASSRKQRGFEIAECSWSFMGRKGRIHEGMSSRQINRILPQDIDEELMIDLAVERKWSIRRDRCFLNFISSKYGEMDFSLFRSLKSTIEKIFHLPGLRGNPERAYPVTAVGDTFPGTYQEYAASIVDKWQTEGNRKKLKNLAKDLDNLGLTSKIVSHRSSSAVELEVGRIAGSPEMVNIADVGVGVSQVLPILVAIQEAEPSHLIYIEQPEIHLHPKAQVALARVLANAAKRGVRMILETHSSLFLLSIQTLIAEGVLPPDKISLNWFERDKDGATHVTQGTLDEYGRFGNWPEDFGSVEMEAEQKFLDAIDRKMRKAG